MTGITVATIVRALERYYRASAEDPTPFVATHEDEEGREVLLLREGDGELEMKLVLPKRIVEKSWETLSLDERCQVVEGASHFLMVCDRAKQARPTTHLELELQAEVDKWLILSRGGRLDLEADRSLRDALFESGTFLHPANTVQGERYRLASSLAGRFVHRLSKRYVLGGRLREMRAELVRFFHMPQSEKLRAVAA
ncbi:MAG: hypothetical protein ACXVEF_10155 [Polyangiales bacterium]